MLVARAEDLAVENATEPSRGSGAALRQAIAVARTLLQPTAGTATINGYDVSRQPGLVRQNLGAVLTGERSIYWKLTGRENLEYFAALNHLPPAIAKNSADSGMRFPR